MVLLVLAPAFGLLLERVIMRGLVGTSEATKLVVSISLLVAMIGLANLIWEPGESRPDEHVLPGRDASTSGVTTITYHQAITIATAIVVAVGLRFLLYRTRIGVSMRANVDDRNLALLNGARPDRVGLLSWAIGAVARRRRRHPHRAGADPRPRRRCRCSSSTPTPPPSSGDSAPSR